MGTVLKPHVPFGAPTFSRSTFVVSLQTYGGTHGEKVKSLLDRYRSRGKLTCMKVPALEVPK